MNGNSGHITPIIPGSLNQKADATPSDAYILATNSSLRQNASDVKQTAVPANEEGAQAPTNPRGRLENQAVVHGGAKAPSLYNILQQVVNVKQKTVLKNNEGANVAVQPTVRPNESSVALGGAKAPSVNSILQKALDVKQGKGHGQHSPFWWA